MPGNSYLYLKTYMHYMKNNQNYIGRDRQKSPSGTMDFIKEVLAAGSGRAASNGAKWGVGAVLTKTVFRRLPAPLNFVVPIIADKIITQKSVDSGRELLLKGLRWIKKATDEDPVLTINNTK